MGEQGSEQGQGDEWGRSLGKTGKPSGEQDIALSGRRAMRRGGGPACL